MALDTKFWSDQRVLVTGHTGFKGAWLSLLLSKLNASISGYALQDAPTNPNLFESAELSHIFSNDTRANILDLTPLKRALDEFQPTILFHMAAQSLVLESYRSPIDTYQVNVMGTANVLEAARTIPSLKAVVIVTTDKCYKNTESNLAYSENDLLGGYDPYSNSKACAELVTDSYRSSFFSTDSNTKIATARAGNVIGGGDWAANRLLPDCFRAFSSETPLELRHPTAIRPWQHVLEPLYGYLLLAEKLSNKIEGADSAWNFGPAASNELETQHVVELAKSAWGSGQVLKHTDQEAPVETKVLRLNSSKAIQQLGWSPRWSAEQAIEKTMSWFRATHEGANYRHESERQIAEYLA